MTDSIYQQIAEKIDGFQVRLQQQQMADFIDAQLQVVNGPRMAVVEAPTGVGKTLGYLSGALRTAQQQKNCW
ncbi:hypothetical protein Q7C_2648 [Methylophaga frappieri]|uniref:Helicase ATP-binding domain-containing protein n=1 Tax=Methylophaga frappieri (strain ATCC BAA-2434 / DSM 25690 / JAM7) TaxID=754477 RepID=I1YLH6_METFJ|nr:hypothetical protein [Methylophaga frappieri]AFJ03769.1 hypothetical protein Q7C_2648 [Methylophaga frappieri]